MSDQRQMGIRYVPANYSEDLSKTDFSPPWFSMVTLASARK